MKIPERLQTSTPWLCLAAAWFALLWYLSSTTHGPVGPSFEGRDKVMHATYFTAGGVCAFFAMWYRQRGSSLRRAALVAVLFCAATGAVDELHQTFTPGRSGNDVWDWCADVCGGFIAVVVCRLILRWQARG